MRHDWQKTNSIADICKRCGLKRIPAYKKIPLPHHGGYKLYHFWRYARNNNYVEYTPCTDSQLKINFE